MSIIATFGSGKNKKVFEVSASRVFTPNGLSISESLELEETENGNGKPTVKVKKIGTRTMSFDVKIDGRLDAPKTTIQKEIDSWRMILLEKNALPFNLGDTYIGHFILTKCDLKDFKIGYKGALLAVTLSLAFSEDSKATEAAQKAANQSYVDAAMNDLVNKVADIQNKVNGTTSSSSTTSKTSSTTKKTSSTATTAKAAKVAASAAKNTAATKKVRKGSIIKPKSGVRWYYTAEGALKKSGTSGKAYHKNLSVYNTYSKNGKIVCVNAAKLGWLKIEDLNVVKY